VRHRAIYFSCISMALQTRLQLYTKLSIARVPPVTALLRLRANSPAPASSVTASHFPSYHQPGLRTRYSTATSAQGVTDTSVQSSLSQNLFHRDKGLGAKMGAQKIDGTALAKRIRDGLNDTIRQKQEKNERYKPSLVIVQGNCSW
jgi:methylenetetrahydrofolate dehydrogenase (NADP+)/methenyltetrahydrofolate cyclohydrolase/formyltetrahydrofolate synthetase